MNLATLVSACGTASGINTDATMMTKSVSQCPESPDTLIQSCFLGNQVKFHAVCFLSVWHDVARSFTEKTSRRFSPDLFQERKKKIKSNQIKKFHPLVFFLKLSLFITFEEERDHQHSELKKKKTNNNKIINR